MTKQELIRVLELQEKAYNLLLWLDEQARHQADLLSDENVASWKYAESCESWVRHMIGTVPRDLRPDDGDDSAFARLFSAFFNTSFRVEKVKENHYHFDGQRYVRDEREKPKLIAGLTNTPKTAGQKSKTRESRKNLQLIALEELAIENDVDLSRAQLETLATRDDLQDAINLYSYAHELVRRSQFASQGAAVHSLWRSIDKKTRQSLNGDVLWAARESLVSVMNVL